LAVDLNNSTKDKDGFINQITVYVSFIIQGIYIIYFHFTYFLYAIQEKNEFLIKININININTFNYKIP